MLSKNRPNVKDIFPSIQYCSGSIHIHLNQATGFWVRAHTLTQWSQHLWLTNTQTVLRICYSRPTKKVVWYKKHWHFLQLGSIHIVLGQTSHPVEVKEVHSRLASSHCLYWMEGAPGRQPCWLGGVKAMLAQFHWTWPFPILVTFLYLVLCIVDSMMDLLVNSHLLDLCGHSIGAVPVLNWFEFKQNSYLAPYRKFCWN